MLRNFDVATKYFDYESKTEINKTSIQKINGWYKFINGLLSAILVIDNNLYILYGENKILILESYKAILKPINATSSELIIINFDKVLLKFSYRLPDSKFNVSPFEYIDEDDFKWGEFIAKIINDKERQRNFAMNLK